MFADDAEELVADLTASGVTEPRVSDYVTELTTMAASYKKVQLVVLLRKCLTLPTLSL